MRKRVILAALAGAALGLLLLLVVHGGRTSEASPALPEPAAAVAADAGPPTLVVPPLPAVEETTAHGMAKVESAYIRRLPGVSADALGILRWGARFEISQTLRERGQTWHRMKNTGWIRDEDVITRRRAPPRLGFVPIAPALDQPLPYRYTRVTAAEGVPVYPRPPRRGEDPRPLVSRSLRQDYFFTVDKWVNIYDRQMYRTTRYWFVQREGTTPVVAPTFEGIEITDETQFPFVWITDPTAILCPAPGIQVGTEEAAARCAQAPRQRRYQLLESRNANGIFYRLEGGRWVSALHVARMDRLERIPRDVRPGERWIHVDLRNQTASLYEGDRMVFATLVSSGDTGHETPTGTFRLQSKHISTTMDNEDNPSGPYYIQDVPWVMFFLGSYAIHGAFWHDRFGLKTSHGCVNLSPPDARRFFQFATTPELPETWHAVFTPPNTRATLVHVTR